MLMITRHNQSGTNEHIGLSTQLDQQSLGRSATSLLLPPLSGIDLAPDPSECIGRRR
jgi:hypothetical protein